jgi:Glycine zipper
MSIFKTFPLCIRNPNQQHVQSNNSPPRAIDVLCVAVLVVYFLHFALPAIGGNLAADEMPELWRYWYHGPLKWIWANICFWRETVRFYRPAGVFYYLPLYHFFGLNPRPYHILQISILAASIPMLYYLTRSLSSSRSVAFLAVLALCYHAGIISLVFVGSFSYDVLCGLFYFAALTYYIHIRERGADLRPLQLLGFLALYVCALDFKEMAVTLPVIVLIYELLKSPHWSDWRQFIGWARSSAAPALVACLLTAFYVYSRTHGPGSMATWVPYRPHYSWSNFLKSNAHFVSELFYYGFPHAISKKALLALWALVFIYAFLRQDRALRLMAFWIVIVPLPLAFIVPIRGGGHLYLLLFGWAMIFAKVASDLIMLISNSSLLIGHGAGAGAATGAIIGGAATGRVRGAAIGAAAGAAAGKMSPSTFRIFAMLVVASSLAIFTQWENQRFGRVRASLNVGQRTSHVIQAFRSLDLHPAPGSTILVKGNPFIHTQGWDPFFIASLVWNDHSLRIWLEGLNKLTPQQLANVDYVISLSEFQAEIVRSPESHQH